MTLIYLAAAVCFVLGLHLMNSPVTARRGNLLSGLGMFVAVAATMVHVVRSGSVTVGGWTALVAGAVVGATAGLVGARRPAMTDMPQLVSLFNAVGGGAAAMVAVHEVSSRMEVAVAIPTSLDVLIGAVTFSGSLIASGKLQGIVPGRPVMLRRGRALVWVLGGTMVLAGGYLATGAGGPVALSVLTMSALGFGIMMVLPIGGADMPVVISMLNACTGTAVAMAGLVIDNDVLIIGGALVGASGAILTKLMADAMNRSLASILIGGFGTGDNGPTGPVRVTPGVREILADDAAILLAYAAKVVIVPGYGLAAAQAQHAVHDLANLLESRGIDVTYAIHPVAGRMPGHMNVLLAEADIPYEKMHDLDEANAELPHADVALVVGANDVTNPAARRPGNSISGMPILDVDRARHVIVIKRSMGHGYAGMDNELYADPRTGMFFADAKAGLTRLVAAVRVLVG